MNILTRPRIVAAPIPSRRLYALDNIRHLRKELAVYQSKKILTLADHDAMEEILSEISHQRYKASIADDLDDFCIDRPDELECRVYDF